MTRHSQQISLSKSDISSLSSLASGTNDRLAVRARIILLCAEGYKVKDIAAELNERPNTVIQWRDRFIEYGVKGLYNRPRGIGQPVYGEPFMEKLRRKLNEPPLDNAGRWTAKALSEALDVPLNVIWKYLQKAGIHLRDIHHSEEEAVTDVNIPVVLKMKIAEKDMANRKAMADIEFIARIRNEDGTYIERKVVLEDAVPEIKDFDFETKEGFLQDFDTYEKAVIKARDKVTGELTDSYLESGVKKTAK